MPVAKMSQGVYLMIISAKTFKFGKSRLFVISSLKIVLKWNVLLFHNLSDALDKMRIASIKRAGIEKVGYFYLP
jgi:hypothetical protein